MLLALDYVDRRELRDNDPLLLGTLQRSEFLPLWAQVQAGRINRLKSDTIMGMSQEEW